MASIKSTGSPYRTRSQISTTTIETEIASSPLETLNSTIFPEEILLDSPSASLESLNSMKYSMNYPPTLATSLHSLELTSISRVVPSLPQADTGRAAYQFLISAFIVEVVVWGLPSSYGVFFQYYTDKGVGNSGDVSGSALLPLVGSISSGLMYLVSFRPTKSIMFVAS